jgi:hypothetical protein
MRKHEILLELMIFHETNKISQNFLGIILCWLLLSISVLLKVERKISVLFRLILNFKVSNLAMAKVKKVNIADGGTGFH